MKRYLYIILFFLVLVTPYIVKLFVSLFADSPAVAGPVMQKVEGRPLQLTIVTPHNQDIRRTFASAFDAWHREKFGRAVEIVYLTPGGTGDIVRMLRDFYRVGTANDLTRGPEQNVNADIEMMWGGGDFPFDVELKPLGVLKPINIDPRLLAEAFPTADIAGVPLYEPLGKDQTMPRWVGIALSEFGIVYSPVVYEELGLAPPTTWSDLADPRLATYIALADPTRSGSAAQAYNTALQRAMADAEEAFVAGGGVKGKIELPIDTPYEQALASGWKKGMGQLLLMAANARYLTESATQMPNDVGNGDAAAGLAIDFYGRVYEETIGRDRIRYFGPRGATAVNADPIAILYGVIGEQEVLANRFVEFLLTPDAQRLWNLQAGISPHVPRSLRRLPIRRDAYSDQTNWSDQVNPFTDTGGFNLRREWSSLLFSEMRMVWAAAWIDARTTLKDAYAQIRAVPDPQKRQQLIDELADVPLTLDGVLQARAQRRAKEKEPGADPRYLLTQRRMEIAQQFRDHYRAVAKKAR